MNYTKKQRAKCIGLVVLFLMVTYLFFPVIQPLHASAVVSTNTLEVTTSETITVLPDASVNLTLLMSVPNSALADMYRQAFAVPNLTEGTETQIPENVSTISSTTPGENVTLKQINASQATIPIRDMLYHSLSEEQQCLLGLNTVIVDSSMIPNSTNGQFKLFANATGFPNVYNVTQDDANSTCLVLGIGPTDSSMLMQYVLTEITFIRMLLEKLSSNQTYTESITAEIYLPDNAELLNQNELASSSWNINLGEGTFVNGGFSVNDSSNAIFLKEEVGVSENNAAAGPSDIYEAFQNFSIPSIQYSLNGYTPMSPVLGSPSLNESAPDGTDFSFPWSIPLWTATSSWSAEADGFEATLTASASLDVSGYVGWDPTIPDIPFVSGPLNSFEAWIKPEAQVAITFEAIASGSFSHEWSWQLFETQTAFTVIIGVVPVIVDVDFTVTAAFNVTFSGQLEFSAGAQANGWLEAGVSWDSVNGWQQI